jgi:hypothetical protein
MSALVLDVVLQGGGLESESIASAVLVFLISLLVGTVAIYFGAQLFIDRDTGYRRAALTAFVGAIVYTVVGLFFGWIPLLGPLVALLAWIGVINWQYPGGWLTAGGIAFVAWLAAVTILFLLAQVGFVTPDALGVPNA